MGGGLVETRVQLFFTQKQCFEIFCNFIYNSLTSFNIIVQHVEASDQIGLDSTIQNATVQQANGTEYHSFELLA